MKRLNTDVVLAEDDTNAWAAEVADVKKLPQAEEKPSLPLIIGDVSPKLDYSSAYSGNKLERLEVGDINNIDSRTASKFLKGEIQVQRRLDLHGLTEAQAKSDIINFVRSSYIKGIRCLLVITGKGMNKETDPWYEKKGILKESLPSWLNSEELRPLILSFCHAKPEDGGDGAFYILLRRKR